MQKFAAVLAILIAAPAAHARPDPEQVAPGEDEQLYRCHDKATKVVITLKPEIEVKDLIAWAMSFTCKKFVYETRLVGKKVTVIAPTSMTPAEGYRLFLVALSTVGLTVVPKGPALRIVEAQGARRESLPIYKTGLPDDVDQVVRYVVRPAHAQPETLLKAFTALKSEAGDIVVVGSILVITDYGTHVRDMMSLASLIDVPGGTDGIYTIPVKHADAAKLGEKINAILGLGVTAAKGESAAATPPSRLLVDERTNTLVLASNEPGYLRVKALVERLDISLDMEDGSAIHIYPLGSAIAEELARTLNDAIGQSQAKTAAKPGSPAPASPIADLGASLEGAVRVISDKPTNSLIVTASGRDFIAMRDVIRQLDQPRRQVFIETLILEVAVSDGLDLGTASHGGIPIDNGTSLVVGGVQTSSLKTLSLSQDASSLGSVSGLLAGVIGSSLAGSSSILGTSIPSYAVLFNALATKDNTNILSAPSIIAVDNEESKYKVGTNIPYKKGLSFPTTSGDSPFNSVGASIDRMDLVLELNIKPHISFDDTILLEIKHDSKDISGMGELGPTWNTRTIETRVLVKDQHTVVIGGLMQTREINTESKVPVLGDIPLLGHLFKYSTKSKKKTNLLILLTPYIIKDQLDLERIRERKSQQHDEFARSFSALSRAQHMPSIDYHRKRGVLEEINRTVLGVEADIEARSARPKSTGVTPGALGSPK